MFFSRFRHQFFLWIALVCTLSASAAEERCPVVVIGGGVAGLTSATFLARAGIVPVVITGPVIGGAIAQSHNVENWPGELSISGTDLSEKMRSQAEALGADLRAEELISVDFSQQPYLITTRPLFGDGQLKHYRTDSCIIALGSTPKRLGVPGESNYWSQGVYTCAVCDGAFYKNKVVAVVGGGDAALIEAQYLANVAAKVHLLVRGQAFRSVEQVRMQEILSHPKIQVHYGTTVDEIAGDGERVTLLKLASGEGKTSTLAVDALFLAIGSQPNSEAFAGQLALYPNGSIKLHNDQETSRPGIYAVGDITDGKYQQAVTAAGSAAKAAIQAQQYVGSILAKQQKKEAEKVASRTVVEIRSMKQFEHELSQSKDPVIVDFYSTRCGPCRTFAPTYDAWARRYGDHCKFLKVNAEHAPEVFNKYSIRAVPTLLLLEPSGKMIRMSVGLGDIGAIEKQLESFQR